MQRPGSQCKEREWIAKTGKTNTKTGNTNRKTENPMQRPEVATQRPGGQKNTDREAKYKYKDGMHRPGSQCKDRNTYIRETNAKTGNTIVMTGKQM